MTIGIYVNELKDLGFTIAKRIIDAVRARGGDTRVAGKAFVQDGADLTGCDAILSVGGDGTLLKAARETLCCGAPLLGINLGSLGYLTEVETSQIDSVLDRIFARDYRVEGRMMLEITRERPNGDRAFARACGKNSDAGVDWNGEVFSTDIALNELYIGRGASPHVVRLKVYLNDAFMDVYSGDGILISTPTGSTAYALSAGGPVIDPELNAAAIIPLCPHMVFSRTVLAAPDKVITIVPVCLNGEFRADIAADGIDGAPLCGDEIIRVRRSGHVTKMLRFEADNFYGAIKNKLFESSGNFLRQS